MATIDRLKRIKDKIEHTIVSAGIFLLVAHFLRSVLTAFLVTIILGIVKEITDEKFDYSDIWADVVGIILGFLVWQL